ncbi:cation:proton antiporter [Natrinema sp. 1APR25-10V2]|nr:cation:proton antiporter [Natrinema sp. 1APR25-10V2]MDS0473947.1 cation:proton antiporter [Natrinema sp. 1APR25-10V2]
MAVEVAAELLDLLTVFIIAAGVGIFVAKVGRFPYTIALLLAGLAVSVINIGVDIELSHDLILLVLLPPLLFEGAATTDLEYFRRYLGPILALAVPGLVLSVIILGVFGQYVFGVPLIVALLFAAMILPTDPVSVLALFEELGAPDRLAVLVEGESLVNDGVVGDEVGEPLLEEVNLKLSRIDQGRSTVQETEEGYSEFWRRRAEEFGLQSAGLTEREGTDDVERAGERGSVE